MSYYHGWIPQVYKTMPLTNLTDCGVPVRYPCKTCELYFQTQGAYDRHVLNHIKCSECDYTAVVTLVRKHESQIHGKKIDSKKLTAPIRSLYKIKLETPEEIEEWIKQRKAKYPTKENVEQKTLQNEMKKVQAKSGLDALRAYNDEEVQKPVKTTKKRKIEKSLRQRFFESDFERNIPKLLQVIDFIVKNKA